MNKKQAKPQPLGPLVPQSVRNLVEQSPVLWFENAEAYDALLRGLLAEYDPISTSETLLVKNLADCHWELLRLQRIRKAALQVNVKTAAYSLMWETFDQSSRKIGCAPSRLNFDRTVLGAVKGEKHYAEDLKDLLDFNGLTPEMLLFEAYSLGLVSINAIETAIARTERQRIALLRLIEQRKSTNAAMNKAFFDGMFSATAPKDQIPSSGGDADGEET